MALLGGLIIAPTCIAFYLYMDRSIESNGLEQANTASMDIADKILGKIDEEILVDFAGQRIAFEKMSVPFNHWAIIRKNGILEATYGIFKSNPFIALETPD